LGKVKRHIIKQKIGKKNLKIIYIALILTLAYFIAYLIMHPMAPSLYDDDTTYEMLAYNYIHGTFAQSPYPYSTRLLQIIPIALFYKAIGVNLLSNAMWNIISSLLLVILTFFIGRELYNEYVGYLSALIMCFFPLVVMLAASSNETIPMSMFAALAVLSFIKGYSKNNSKWYFITGISIFASFLASPLGILIGIIIFFYLILITLYSKFKKSNAVVSLKGLHIISGIAFSVLILLIYNYITCGDPLVTFNITLNFASGPLFIKPAINMQYYTVLFPPFTKNLPGYINIGYVLYLFFIAAPYLVIKKVKQAFLPIFWFSFGLLYLWIGPMYISLFPFKYMTIPPVWRYLTILAAPAAVTVSIFIVRMFEIYKKHRIALGILFFLVMFFIIYSSIRINLYEYSFYVKQISPIFYLAQYLNALPNSTTIYLPLQLPNLEVYMHFDNASRFVYYNMEVTNCTYASNYNYIVTVKFPGVLESRCPSWSEVDFINNKTEISENGIYLYRPN